MVLYLRGRESRDEKVTSLQGVLMGWFFRVVLSWGTRTKAF